VSSVVLDASVVLAIVHQEPGAERLTPNLLSESAISTVNLAEAQSKLVLSGWSAYEAWLDATSPVSEIIPFTVTQARTAASLITQTRPLGLSLGDRACLALALEMKAPVYTADRSWKKLKLGIRIHVIR
jgi:PIN domain nuclease of toxin-antitoxin system